MQSVTAFKNIIADKSDILILQSIMVITAITDLIVLFLNNSEFRKSNSLAI